MGKSRKGAALALALTLALGTGLAAAPAAVAEEGTPAASAVAAVGADAQGAGDTGATAPDPAPAPQDPAPADPDPSDPDPDPDPGPAEPSDLAPASAAFSATVTLPDSVPAAGSLSVNLSRDGAVVQTVACAADGTVTFAPVEFDAPGTYTLSLAMAPSSDSSVKADGRTVKATVTVTTSADGSSLSATVSYDGAAQAPVFACTYVPGWQGTGASKRYRLQDGTYAMSRWMDIDGRRFAFDGAGHVRTGWFDVGGRWYYLAPGSGAMATGWAKVGGAWYWLEPSGAMAEGWRSVGGRWYYLAPGSGAMATGWAKVGGAWYWLEPSGAMAEGWRSVGGRWYYLAPGSGAMATGWAKVGGAWYWLEPSGAMATNQWVDSGRYWVNGSGAWVPGQAAKTGWQNPSGYYKVSSKTVTLPISAVLLRSYYVSPSTIMPNATRAQCVNAFVNRAYQYLGTPYRWNWSHSPGSGVDCIGLVYQCAYATGMSMGEYNPYNHWVTGPNGWHSHDANNVWNNGKIQRLPVSSRQRGDLVFWPGHVAIYIGGDRIIEAWPGTGVRTASLWAHGTPRGIGRLYI